MKLCEIDVLGTSYKVYEIDPEDESVMDSKGGDCMGFCDHTTKEIMLRGSMKNPEPDDCANLEYEFARVMRHEITHAFIYESGMTGVDLWEGSYYQNETLIDWFAVQSPKMLKAFEKAGCL